MNEEKFCESCGMPMKAPADFGAGRPDNPYCVHCTDAEGALKPYAVVLENMKNFAVQTMGVAEMEALKMAREGMAGLPAWKDVPVQE
ncbi:MAG: zinc ribbon domain-containing protein [Chloroflexota bacterium]